MSLIKWIAGFQEIHARARKSLLNPSEMAGYLEQRDELARMLLGAQQLLISPGQQPRKALRVAKPLHLELELASGGIKTRTLDISSGGFAVMLDQGVAPGSDVGCKLVLPRDGLVQAQARAVASKPSGARFRVAFTMPHISEEDRERVEFTVFDSVLEIMSS